MEAFINFISAYLLGVLTILIFTKNKIKIQVHHINENVVSTAAQPDMKAIEKEMLDKTPNEQDDLYQTQAIMNDVIATMGGSDRL